MHIPSFKLFRITSVLWLWQSNLYQHARDIVSHSHVLFFQLFEYEENPQKLRMPDDSDIDDDLSDCYVNDSSEEEEGETAVKTLEWDDSTLSY